MNLKKVSRAETPAIVETMASNTVVSKKDHVGQAISLEVNEQLSAIRKRKCNVIVTGLPEQV